MKVENVVSDDLVATLVEKTKAALKNTSRSVRPPETLNLAGYSNQTEIWGADSALDFIETKWSGVSFYLRESAEAKKMHANILMPTLGARAAKQIDDFVQQALPGCKVCTSGSMMSIDWTDLI